MSVTTLLCGADEETHGLQSLRGRIAAPSAHAPRYAAIVPRVRNAPSIIARDGVASRHDGVASRHDGVVTHRDAVAIHLDTLDAAPARGGISQRKAQGSHYTPIALVDFLLTEALRGARRSPMRAIDPACGSGNFLVAAVASMRARTNRSVAEILERSIFGVDIDAVAAQLAREALLALLPARTSTVVRRRVSCALGSHIVVADAIELDIVAHFGHEAFDLVLGNPPFLNQLEKGTAASRARAEVLSRATGGAVKRYTDVAAAFLLRGLDLLADDGRLAFVMPQSFLAASDARAARDAALMRAQLASIWSCEECLFEDANVRVCALVFRRPQMPARATRVRRAFGANFQPLRLATVPPCANEPTWSRLLAEGFGAPIVPVRCSGVGTLGDVAGATADFRDQYYGLRGAIVECASADDTAFPPLVSTRFVDLARSSWGDVEAKILGARYRAPRVDRAALAVNAKMSAWMMTRLVPKVLVATQTRIIEAWVDEPGRVLPLVPLITVVPKRVDELWLVAAAIASPVIAAHAVALYAGSAMSSGAIKLSARQLLAMPLPTDAQLWRKSAQLFESASRQADASGRARALNAYAEASCQAHQLTPQAFAEVMRFWRARAESTVAGART